MVIKAKAASKTLCPIRANVAIMMISLGQRHRPAWIGVGVLLFAAIMLRAGMSTLISRTATADGSR
jgi:hypothetical protein